MIILPAFVFFLNFSYGNQNYGHLVLCPRNVLTLNCPIHLKIIFIQLTITFKDLSLFSSAIGVVTVNSILTSSLVDSALLMAITLIYNY